MTTKTRARPRIEALERELGAPAEIPSLEAVHEPYGAALRLRGELCEKLEAATAAHVEARGAFEDAVAQCAEARASAIAAGGEPDAEVDRVVEETREVLAAAERGRTDLARAQGIADEAVGRERNRAEAALRDLLNREIDDARPRVVALVRELCAFSRRQQEMHGCVQGLGYIGNYPEWAALWRLETIIEGQAKERS